MHQTQYIHTILIASNIFVVGRAGMEAVYHSEGQPFSSSCRRAFCVLRVLRASLFPFRTALTNGAQLHQLVT